MFLTERCIWLHVRHIWTISSTQPLAQNEYEAAHLLLSHTFLHGRSSSALRRWHTCHSHQEVFGRGRNWKKASSQASLWAAPTLPFVLVSRWWGAEDQHPGITEVPGPGGEEPGQKQSRQPANATAQQQLDGKKQQIWPSSASYHTYSEKLCIHVVWNAAILVQGLQTGSPEGGGIEERGLFSAPLQLSCELSCETSAKSLTSTLLYPFTAILERHMKQ